MKACTIQTDLKGEYRVCLVGNGIEHAERNLAKALERISRVRAAGPFDDRVVDGLMFRICDIT